MFFEDIRGTCEWAVAGRFALNVVPFFRRVVPLEQMLWHAIVVALWHLLCFRAPACTILSTPIFPVLILQLHANVQVTYGVEMNKFGMPQATFWHVESIRWFVDLANITRLVTWRLSMGSHLALLRPVLRRVAPRPKHLARRGPRARRVVRVVSTSNKDWWLTYLNKHHTTFAVDIICQEDGDAPAAPVGARNAASLNLTKALFFVFTWWSTPRDLFCFAFRIVGWLCYIPVYVIIFDCAHWSFIYHHGALTGTASTAARCRNSFEP